MNKRLVLASASPRRRRLLQQIGLDFQVIPSQADEDIITHSDPMANIQAIALRKAREVSVRVKNAIVIGADTQIFVDGETIGKPTDADDAVRTLSRLNGRTHRVVTGVALIDTDTGTEETWAETTMVTFRMLSKDEISDYVKTGEHIGKAGAYGIQGRAAAFVERIEGCYFNVVGLPLSRLSQKLKKLLV